METSVNTNIEFLSLIETSFHSDNIAIAASNLLKYFEESPEGLGYIATSHINHNGRDGPDTFIYYSFMFKCKFEDFKDNLIGRIRANVDTDYIPNNEAINIRDKERIRLNTNFIDLPYSNCRLIGIASNNNNAGGRPFIMNKPIHEINEQVIDNHLQGGEKLTALRVGYDPDLAMFEENSPEGVRELFYTTQLIASGIDEGNQFKFYIKNN